MCFKITACGGTVDITMGNLCSILMCVDLNMGEQTTIQLCI